MQYTIEHLDKLGLIINFVGTILVAIAFGKNPGGAYQTEDGKKGKTHFASLLYPNLFKFGLLLLASGFLLQLFYIQERPENTTISLSQCKLDVIHHKIPNEEKNEYLMNCMQAKGYTLIPILEAPQICREFFQEGQPMRASLEECYKDK
jgi:hypothetical protein